MEEKIKRDILNVLVNSLNAAKKEDIKEIKEQSNKVIHNAIIYQDKDSILVAVILYSVSKVLERVEANVKLVMGKIKGHLQEAIDFLKKNDKIGFERELKHLNLELNKLDPKLKLHIKEVFEKAKVNKASRLYEHGISAGRTADLLGITTWELMEYSGETGISEKGVTKSIKDRIKIARNLNRNLVFDTSSVITLSLNNLHGKLNQLKKISKGKFLITREVKEELVDRPIKGKKFKLEALQIQRLIKAGILEVVNKKINVDNLLNIVNNIYSSSERELKILSKGELQALILAVELNSAYVVDERTMRMIIEDPEGLRVLLEKKLKTKIRLNKQNLSKFKGLIKNIDIIRSCDLMIVAFEKGLFKSLGSKKEVLDALLWGLKLRGCAISVKEIKEVNRIYK